MARVGGHRRRPARRDAQLADRPEVVDGVVDERLGAEGRARPGLDRAPGEVAILAARLAAEGLRVEAVDALEQLPWVGHVAGRKRGVERGHARSCARTARGRRARPGLARSGPGRSRPGWRGRRPRWRGANRRRRAVVVGEGDQRRFAGAPALVARRRRAGGDRARDRAQWQPAPGALGGEHGVGRRRGAVGDHEHLVGGPLLLGQRPQQLREPCGAIVRGDDDRDRRSHGRNA